MCMCVVQNDKTITMPYHFRFFTIMALYVFLEEKVSDLVTIKLYPCDSYNFIHLFFEEKISSIIHLNWSSTIREGDVAHW